VAPGVWYSIVGTGETLLATIFAAYDSQVNVYSGESCDSLTCIDGNDEAPYSEGSSQVAWDTTEGQPYYILVHGYSFQVGGFRLNVNITERPFNDVCTGAFVLEIGDVVAASTALATEDGTENCGNALGGDLSAPGIWYRLEGTGATLSAAVTASYDIQISVFSGTACDSLVCVDGTEGEEPQYTSGSVAWDSIEGEIYFVLVHGFSQRIGDFELSVLETVRPENDVCTGAFDIDINSMLNGSTVLATDEDVETCGTVVGGNFSSPGVFYKLEGIDGTISVGVESDYNMQLSLYSGDDCDSLVCEAGRPGADPFLETANVLVDSEVGKTYYIYVHGFSAVGEFTLQTAEVTRPGNDRCSAASSLNLNSDTTGSTLYASSESVANLCGNTNPDSAPGVWFVVEGDGDALEVSFSANFDAQLTVFEGDDCMNLACIDGTDGDSPDYLTGSVRWSTEPETAYYLFMHGFDEKVGEFSLAISGGRESIPPENDVCSDALEIQPNGEVVRGSTVLATQDDIAFAGCGGSLGGDSSAQGVWYSIVRPSDQLLNVAASANYDIQLTIWEGNDCDALECVDGTQGNTPTLTSGSVIFEAVEGVEYSIFVHGFEGSVGEFALSIDTVNRPPNDACENAIQVPVDLAIGGSTSFASSNDITSCGK
jgi:hypothetical protein